MVEQFSNFDDHRIGDTPSQTVLPPPSHFLDSQRENNTLLNAIPTPPIMSTQTAATTSSLSSATVTQDASQDTSPQATPSNARAACRELIQEPPRRRKRVHGEANLESSEELQMQADKLNRKTRWLMLLYLNNVHHDKVIKQVFSPAPDPDSVLYRTARTTIFNTVKAYKHDTVENMITHVKKCKGAVEEYHVLRTSQDIPTLNNFFRSTFSKENFLHVFHFMQGYMEVDKSSDLGKYYLTNIYANLATQCKLLVDKMEKGENGIKDFRHQLLEFFDVMATRKEFDSVTKAEFVEIFKRSARRRVPKKQKRLADNDTRFHMSAAPPPPPAASSGSSDDL
ncbi:MAG: hypothetical protein M4579_007018 [Chaenotheca gracillima]|nr:MAG: hypothetical protein M4579_007018 [Chaenotheca gracillima]